MIEHRAWLLQATSDAIHGDRVLDRRDGSTFCHAIAKFQQSVEKSIKALVGSLHFAGAINVSIGYDHGVEQFMTVLVRLRQPTGEKKVAAAIRRLLDANIRRDIRAIDQLVPRRPVAGTLPRRNTEYPFCATLGDWQAPAQSNVFDATEVSRFRELAHKLVDGCSRIISAIERAPR